MDLSIHHCLNITDALIGSVVFHHRIRLKYVGADLTPPGDILLLDRIFRPLFIPDRPVVFIQAAAKHLEGNLFVHDLGTLILTLNDDPRFKVGNSNRAVGLIDVLASRSPGPVGIEAIILRLQVDLDLIIDDRRGVHAGKGGVSSFLGIEGADPHQAVNSRLPFQISEAVRPGDFDGSAFDSPLILLKIEDLGLEIHQFAVAQVHPHQHLGPVTRFIPPGPGVDRQERIVLVELAVQKGFELQFLICIGYRGDVGINLFLLFGVVRLIRIELDKLGEVVDLFDQLLPGLIGVFQGIEPAERLFGSLPVIPECRLECPFLQGLNLFPD